jgi:hypothetical protein
VASGPFLSHLLGPAIGRRRERIHCDDGTFGFRRSHKMVDLIRRLFSRLAGDRSAESNSHNTVGFSARKSSET